MVASDRFVLFVRSVFPLLILMVGIGISVLVYTKAEDNDVKAINNTLALRSEWRALDLQHKLLDASAPIEALAGFMFVSGDIASDGNKIYLDEFQRFAIIAKGSSSIARLMWAPLVSSEDRAGFETDVRLEDDTPKFAIVEHGPDTAMVAASLRNQYLPVRFEERFEADSELRGFDLLSNPAILAAAESARDSGRAIASVPFAPASRGQGGRRYLIMRPIYRGGQLPTTVEERQTSIIGYVAGTVPIVEMFESAIQNTPAIVETLSMFVDHQSDLPFAVPEGQFRPGEDHVRAGSGALGGPAPGAIRIAKSFDELGLTWTFVFDFAPDVVARMKSPARLWYLGGGALLTLLLASFVFSLQRRQSAVEALVLERTRDLNIKTEALSAIIKASPLATAALDTEHRITHWNSAAEKLYGYSSAEMIGKQFSCIPDDQEEAFRVLLDRVAKGEAVRGVEMPLRRKDGTTFQAAVWAAAFLDSAGVSQGSIFKVEDITERIRGERELRRQRDTAQNYLDVAGVMILAVNSDGTVASINRKGCAILGYEGPEGIVGTSWIDNFIPERLRTETRIAFDRQFNGGEPPAGYYEHPVLTKRGEERVIAWQNANLIDDHGRRVATLSSGEDVTERKRVEEQLQQSQKMEAVGRLTGGVAHDFNNLLTVILGNLEQVREKVEGDSRVTRQIDSAIGAGRRGADLTHRLLAFSRRQPLEPKSIDVNKRIADLVPLLSHTIGETIQVKPMLGGSLWNVVVDPGQLESSIMNLAVNARDAMPNGGILGFTTENLVVDHDFSITHQALVPGNYVRISVSDTGTGMTSDVIDQAFEPFFTTKEVGKGTGLGLSMIYGFVKQSGGYVSIYSEIGVGTTVSMLLPADQAEPARIVASKAMAAPRTGTEKILVVEDDPEVLSVVVSFLEALGYQTIEARGVSEGFELFVANPGIDMILTDLILPGGINGAEFARRARALRPATKVLFMSGYTEDIVMHNARLDSAVVLLRKPFTRAQLAEKVRTVIDAAPAMAAQ